MKFFRTKQVGHLRDLLRDHGIRDEPSLRRLIDGQSSIAHGEATFQVIRARDLGLDNERRSYLDPFEFRETIFDCGDIRLQNSEKIRLVDCVVLGTLFIGNKTGRSISIELDTAAVTGELKLMGGGSIAASISMNSVRAGALSIDALGCSKLHAFDTAFVSTTFSRLECGELLALGNRFGDLTVSDCTFEEVRFPSHQFDMRALGGASGRLRRRAMRTFRPLDFGPLQTYTDEVLAGMSRAEAARQKIETLAFLSRRADDRHSKRDAAQLRYLRALAESRGRASRALVAVSGALIKPARIVALSAMTILVFGFAFFWQKGHLGGAGVASFWDALYFSGLTFTTIGYGDITPMGVARALAVAEGLLGIALSSAFVVSVVRRYID